MLVLELERPDADLIRRAAAGEERAQTELIRPWVRVVTSWAARLGPVELEPEDIASEVFIVVLRRLGTLESPDNFKAWLYGITSKTVTKYRRRAWWQRWSGPPNDEVVDSGADSPSKQYRSQVTSRNVATLLQALTAQHREILVLMDVEERAGSEVASLLQIPEPTVRSRLRRARERFAKLAPQYGLAPDSTSMMPQGVGVGS